ncbi:hypothetical protein FSZ31_04260 [Sphingorhabdus soli]|uniref:Uncharacterized protein n=1 Tax=Flavisphingopyxis soli TaxID=2601267 RepID=A0A5C6UP67_9SPHN|nr:hypothetical protein [Sphingorhabdus soli]TXC73941.1 hypothetical protein FSZ31_04260 [Sphingorhabdus soli]
MNGVAQRGPIIVDEVPTISIGPLSMAIEAGALEAWCAAAQAGDVLVYAHGPVLPRTAAVVTLAREYADAGLVTLSSQRVAKGFEWNAVRSRVRAVRDISDRRAEDALAALSPPEEGSVDDIILRALKRAANFNAPCPSNADLARLARLDTPVAASDVIKRLKKRGAITVLVPAMGGRVVTIAATGKRTAQGSTQRGSA